MKLDIPSAAPKDLATLHRWLLEAFRRSGDSYGGRVIRRVNVGTTETRIAHGLTERPLAIFWAQDGVTRVGRTRSDDTRFVYLQASTATKVDILVIPGTAGVGNVLDIVDETNAGSASDAAASAGVTERGFRSMDQGGAHVSQQTRVHLAGYANTGSGFTQVGTQNLQGVGTGQIAYAIPETFERACTINRMITRQFGGTSAAGTPRIRFGIFADSILTSGNLAGSPYPGALLAQSAILALTAGFSAVEDFAMSVPIAAGTRVWMVMMLNDQAITDQINIPVLEFLYPILGFTFHTTFGFPVTDDVASAGQGWRHAVTFGTTESFPNPFPQSAPVVLTESAGTADIPAIFYGLQY